VTDKITELANQIVAGLRDLGDPVRAENETRYFRGTINCLGTGLPAMQRLEKRLCRGVRGTWSLEEAFGLADELLEMRIFEVTLFALTMLERFAGEMGEAEIRRFHTWLEADLLDNWAAVDTLGPHIVGAILERSPELSSIIRSWADSPNRWVRRASAVSFVILLRKGLFIDLAYEIAETLIEDKVNDLVQKGTGWMLREAGTTNMARLERFLIAHGPDVPRTTLRYAVEKFDGEKRREIMEKTRRR